MTNAGTVAWSGAGDLGLYDSGIYNLTGALFDIQTDQSIPPHLGNNFINNAGTLRKSAGSGVNSIGVPLANAGTVEAGTGTLDFAGGYLETAPANLAVYLGGTTPGSGFGHINFGSTPNLLSTFQVDMQGG